MQQCNEERRSVGRAPFEHSKQIPVWKFAKNKNFSLPHTGSSVARCVEANNAQSEWQFDDDKVTMMNKVFSEKKKQTNIKAAESAAISGSSFGCSH